MAQIIKITIRSFLDIISKYIFLCWGKLNRVDIYQFQAHNK